jgi:hypothetical protein
MTFNEAEMATSINIRSLPQKATTLTTSTETTETIEIIENAPDANDVNIIHENIENAPLESITVEPAPVRRSTRHRKAIFKAIGANTVAANAVEVAETPTISADKKESEKEDYLSKAIIVKSIIANEDKPTYEEAITGSKEF